MAKINNDDFKNVLNDITHIFLQMMGTMMAIQQLTSKPGTKLLLVAIGKKIDRKMLMTMLPPMNIIPSIFNARMQIESAVSQTWQELIGQGILPPSMRRPPPRRRPPIRRPIFPMMPIPVPIPTEPPVTEAPTTAVPTKAPVPYIPGKYTWNSISRYEGDVECQMLSSRVF